MRVSHTQQEEIIGQPGYLTYSPLSDTNTHLVYLAYLHGQRECMPSFVTEIDSVEEIKEMIEGGRGRKIIKDTYTSVEADREQKHFVEKYVTWRKKPNRARR